MTGEYIGIVHYRRDGVAGLTTGTKRHDTEDAARAWLDHGWSNDHRAERRLIARIVDDLGPAAADPAAAR